MAISVAAFLRVQADSLIDGLATAATTVRVAKDLIQPVFVTSAPKDTRRLFILEKLGVIRVLNLETGRINPIPFLELANVQIYGEGSLLGMAFAPEFADSGQFFVSYPRSTGGRFVVSYHVAAGSDVADSSSARDVFRFGNNTGVHIGGWIGFRPGTRDLFVTSGDGDGLTPETDHPFLAQNPASLQGKIYRIRPANDGSYVIPTDNPWVDGSRGFRAETWAFGVRNPWRASFDRMTGDFWFGDVGGSQREEVDFEPAASSGGRNYGWSSVEGNLPTGSIGATNAPGVPPTAPVNAAPRRT